MSHKSYYEVFFCCTGSNMMALDEFSLVYVSTETLADKKL